MKDTENILGKVRHPVFISATIDTSLVVWDIYCLSCGTMHKVSIEDSELDYCCAKQDVGALAVEK